MKTTQWALASLLALTAPVFAQTETPPVQDDKPAVKTEKLWRIETSGIGG